MFTVHAYIQPWPLSLSKLSTHRFSPQDTQDELLEMAGKAIAPTAGKATCVPEREQSTLPVFKVAKSCTTKRRTKKFILALQRPIAPPGKVYSVRILENGLVDTSKTPDYLTAAVKRNNLQSPLLCLPPTVRMKIWVYAIGGNAVEIKLRSTEVVSTSTATQAHSNEESMYHGYAAVPGPSDRKTRKLRAAFHLPEVCRVIYRETATLGYILNDFVFIGEIANSFGRENGPDGAFEGWSIERIPAQLNAIKTIRPHWIDVLEYIQQGNRRSMKSFYPGLKQVLVPKRTVSAEACAPERGGPMRRLLRQQAKKRIVNRVKELDGEDTEVVF